MALDEPCEERSAFLCSAGVRNLPTLRDPRRVAERKAEEAGEVRQGEQGTAPLASFEIQAPVRDQRRGERLPNSVSI